MKKAGDYLLNANAKILQTYTQPLSLLLKTCDADDSHQMDHFLRVMNRCYDALKCRVNCDFHLAYSVLLAALLHDADDPKLFPKGSKNAYNLMKAAGESSETISLTLKMIDLVSFSKNGNNIDLSIPEEQYYPRYADRLEATGEIGIIRAYIYGHGKGNPICTGETTRPKNKEELELAILGRDQLYLNRGGTSVSIVDHLMDKILHIEKPNTENIYWSEAYAKERDVVIKLILTHSATDYKHLESYIKDLCRK